MMMVSVKIENNIRPNSKYFGWDYYDMEIFTTSVPNVGDEIWLTDQSSGKHQEVKVKVTKVVWEGRRFSNEFIDFYAETHPNKLSALEAFIRELEKFIGKWDKIRVPVYTDDLSPVTPKIYCKTI